LRSGPSSRPPDIQEHGQPQPQQQKQKQQQDDKRVANSILSDFALIERETDAFDGDSDDDDGDDDGTSPSVVSQGRFAARCDTASQLLNDELDIDDDDNLVGLVSPSIAALMPPTPDSPTPNSGGKNNGGGGVDDGDNGVDSSDSSSSDDDEEEDSDAEAKIVTRTIMRQNLAKSPPAPASPSEEVTLEEIFDFIDVNGDGFLDLEEVPYYTRCRQRA
jgi:hypothetical protein